MLCVRAWPLMWVVVVAGGALVAPSSPAWGKEGPAPGRGPALGASDVPSFRPGVVAVIRPPGSDGASHEIVTRIVAELMADDVPVVAVTCLVADASCGSLAGMRLSAVVVVQRRDDVRAVEVRTGEARSAASAGRLVTAGDSGRVHRLADSDAAAGPAALAIRTVELLKAILQAFDGGEVVAGGGDSHPVIAQKADPEPGSEITAAGDRRRAVVAVGPRNLTMNVGVNVLGGFSGIATAYGPALSVGRRAADHVMLSVMVAGPAFNGDRQHVAGVVSVRQEMAVAQVELLGLFWNWMVLRAGVGAGVYHIQVDGQVTLNMEVPGETFPISVSGSGGGFAGLLSWSAGMVVNLRDDVGIFLDGRMFVLTPTPLIVLDGVEIGRTGNPGIAVTSGLELRF